MRDMVQVGRSGGNRFAEEPQARIGRSQFNRSHGRKMSFDASYLYPILVDEVLPGDTFTCRLNGFTRIFSPLDAPVMDNIELETFYFFIPSRLVWEHWEAFNGAHDGAGAQDTNYTIPVMGAGLNVNHNNSGYGVGHLAGFMGLPEGLLSAQVNINSLPFRCYNRVYNEWFRDQNLTDELTMSVADASDTTSWYAIKKSAKKHDYFTGALPYLQKGDAQAVSIGTTAPIVGMGKLNTAWLGAGPYDAYETNTTAAQSYVNAAHIDGTSGNNAWYVEEDPNKTGYPGIYADLTAATGVTINALRESVAIQRLLEKDARGGTRYVELIKSHFGVTSPDFRLQRPEFLGGGKSYINISPVANTSDTATWAQGELAGVGTGVMGGGFAKSFTEHGYILGLMRARGDVTYFQGVDKLWSRTTRYDFYIPALANLGEQSVLNKELFVSNSAATDNAVFGYQERWNEYRHKPSQCIGLFNPDVSGSLSHWHLAEDFASLPSLNTTFIEDATPMSRVTTVDTEHDFIADMWFDYRCARPMPVHSIPSLMGGRF